MASIAISAGELGGSIYQPVAVAEAAYGHREEVGLIRCKPGKIANPGPAHTETEQNERQNAAGRGGEGSDEAPAAINRCWRCTFVVRASWLIVMAA